MRALLQRVRSAAVRVDGVPVGEIGAGLLVLLGVSRDDRDADAERLAERVVRYRLFEDDAGRMNRSLVDCGGALLVVSQFTLCADTRSGLRPSFSPAAAPEEAERLYRQFVEHCSRWVAKIETGRFGARMQVELINDGPVTLLLES